MKKLKRPISPKCLAHYKHGADDWNTLNDEKNICKQEIWEKLGVMQNGFCAYCECQLKEKNKHIEHFKRKSKNYYPKLTFEWQNLFGSCSNSSRCGDYKDRPKSDDYSPHDLIKPDEDCPSDYLLFLVTGGVSIKSKLGSKQKYRANETIRVFNLNGDPSLVNSRRNALRNVSDEIEQFYIMQDEFEIEEWQEFLKDELALLINREYQTALEHAWKYNEQYDCM
jgi:uncharacterized protein (TIGR02646 family)